MPTALSRLALMRRRKSRIVPGLCSTASLSRSPKLSPAAFDVLTAKIAAARGRAAVATLALTAWASFLPKVSRAGAFSAITRRAPNLG
jgi:hypothetical protein